MPLLLFAIGLGVTFLAHTAPFPFMLDWLAGRHGLWHVSKADDRRVIYLTFDDGPNPTFTPKLLDVLAKERARATFFLIDRYVTSDTAPIVRRMFDEGHSVALHSHTRAPMFMTEDQLRRTLEAAAANIQQLTGHSPCRAFRPHGGWRSRSLYVGLTRMDYTLVGWGWNLWDWNWFPPRTADSIVPRLLGRASSGDIIVMHDGHHNDPTKDRSYSIEATSKLVPALRGRGFTFGTICEALDKMRGRSPNL